MPSLRNWEREDVENHLDELEEKTKEFHEGKVSIKDYKGYSGKYGTFGQRKAKNNMLRLRMDAGILTKEKTKFIVDFIRSHDCGPLHSATCQTVQVHDLSAENVVDGIEEALKAGIVTYGTGGDYPRNIMCSPLAGVDPQEFFDVSPYALCAAKYLIDEIDDPKLPRKMKTAFSGSGYCNPHATYRDLGFVARENGTFDVYAAGGLGPNPRFGTKVAENVDPSDVLYYVWAMINTYRRYGDNTNKTRARTRYMIEKLGGEEAFKKAYLAELDVIKNDPSLKITDLPDRKVTKVSDGSLPPEDWRIVPQKQKGLYALRYHAIGGMPDPDVFCELYETIEPMEQVEVHTSPEQTFFIVNLTGSEAKKVLDVIKDDCALSPFESSVSCIGADRCLIGVRDSQEMLRRLIREVRKANLPASALPQIHISGCPNSCGAHQTGRIGLRGGVKVADGKVLPAYSLFIGGCDEQDEPVMGEMAGTLPEEKVVEFILKLGRTVADSALDYDSWVRQNPDGLQKIADEFFI